MTVRLCLLSRLVLGWNCYLYIQRLMGLTELTGNPVRFGFVTTRGMEAAEATGKSIKGTETTENPPRAEEATE